MGLDCFFAIWFVVGNVWIFGGNSPASEAPSLYREDLNQTMLCQLTSSNLRKAKSGSNRDANSGTEEGGIVAAGTDKERVISAEDAAYCICLVRYANNDELRELQCSHFHLKDCTEKAKNQCHMSPLQVRLVLVPSGSNSNASQGQEEASSTN